MRQKSDRCRTCGEYIPKSAKHCPYCGAWHYSIEARAITLFVVVPLLVLALIWTYKTDDVPQPPASSNHSTIKDAEPDAVPAEILEISSIDLWDAYSANKVNADILYKGQLLSITGEITDIGQDLITKYPCISLSSGDPYSLNAIQCFFPGDTDDMDAIAQLEDGQTITITGICKGTPILNVQISDCYISD